MRKLTLVLAVVFLFALLLVIVPVSDSAITQEIIGTVTLVGDRVIRVKDDSGQTHSFSVPQSKLENVNTGYRVAIKERNNKLISPEVIGVPAEAKTA